MILAKDAAIYLAINVWRKKVKIKLITINHDGAREGTRTPTPYGAGT
jgi:hypothetical protein